MVQNLALKKNQVSVKSVTGDTWSIIRKSIGTKVHTYRNTGVTIAVVGPRKNFFAANGERVDKILIGMERGWKKRTKVLFRMEMEKEAAQVFSTEMEEQLRALIFKELKTVSQALKEIT